MYVYVRVCVYFDGVAGSMIRALGSQSPLTVNLSIILCLYKIKGFCSPLVVNPHLALSPGPTLHGRRAWYAPAVHAPVCTQNLGTSYIPVKSISLRLRHLLSLLAFSQQTHEVSAKTLSS